MGNMTINETLIQKLHEYDELSQQLDAAEGQMGGLTNAANRLLVLEKEIKQCGFDATTTLPDDVYEITKDAAGPQAVSTDTRPGNAQLQAVNKKPVMESIQEAEQIHALALDRYEALGDQMARLYLQAVAEGGGQKPTLLQLQATMNQRKGLEVLLIAYTEHLYPSLFDTGTISCIP
ncbi:hypothetical protein ACFL6C_04850 [Myxococcota bacterium]